MKRLSLLFSSLLLILLLCSCHGARNIDAFALPEDLDTAGQYEITFWAKNDTNKTQTRIYEQAIADFEALYPNIHVNLRLYTDYGKIYNDVITNISTGTTPNVCITYPDHIATYLTGTNVVVPLEELFENPSWGLGGSALRFQSPRLDEMVPEFLNECWIQDHCYAVPFMRSTEALYINKTYVEAMGYTIPDVPTWDFIWEVAEEAAKKDAEGTYLVNGQKVMIPFIYKSTDNMMIQMLRQLNAPYSNDAGEILLFNDTTKELLYEIASHSESGGAFSTFKISSYPGNFLNAGQCIFAIDSTAGSTWLGTHAPLSDISADKVVEFETAVRPIPQFDPDHPKMISQGPSICIFNKPDSQEVLASWLFTQFLLTNDVQIAYARTEGYVPVTEKARSDSRYTEYLNHTPEQSADYYEVKLLASRLLIDHTSDTFVTPVFNGSTSLRDAAGQLIENTVKSVRRKETINDAYFDKLYSDVISLYRLDQTRADVTGKAELGPLPKTAVVLLVSLCCVWVLLGVYALFDYLKKRKKGKAV